MPPRARQQASENLGAASTNATTQQRWLTFAADVFFGTTNSRGASKLSLAKHHHPKTPRSTNKGQEYTHPFIIRSQLCTPYDMRVRIRI